MDEVCCESIVIGIIGEKKKRERKKEEERNSHERDANIG